MRENLLTIKYPELASEWSDKNNPMTVNTVTYGSNKIVWWKGGCGHEWQASVKSRVRGEGCPFCSGKRVLPGFNDLKTKAPELSEEWSDKNEMQPDSVTFGSQRKVWWKGRCGHEWMATIKNRVRGAGCPYCSGNEILKGTNDLRQVRFLLGSTQKMGAGTNVQDRLIALHHLDVPWRPSDIEQQEGRILRQGNLNPKVKIFRYVTEGTFDSYSWQLIENKQKFIGQIMTSKSPVRSCEDVDEAAFTYAEVKALATGNPYIKEKMDLDIQVSKLKLMKANHTSQKYRLEDNIAKHYPQQITILKERISGMQADIQTAKANLPVDKEQFSMKVGDKLYTDKKEAGTALVEMCKEIKTVNAPAVIGEYAGFKMAVSFDAFNHKFVMNLKGQLSHNLEVGSDPLGNISRINHALESMPKQLMEAQTKLETVEHQLETAKVEVTKPFVQEAELAEKLERLSVLNALLNMDEKGNDGIDMDDEPEAPKSEKEVADRPAKNIPIAEKAVGTEQDKGIRQYADAPAERVSLKAKLEVMKAKVAGEDTEKPMPQKAKGKEETL